MTAPRLDFTPACVLFDLDGTLVDTAPDLGRAANLVREEVGLPALPLVDYRPVASSGARGLLGVALGITPDHADFPVRRDSFLAHYRAGLTVGSRPFPGIDELLLGFELKGIRWGVVTNKADWLAQPLLQELGLAERAACIVGGDTVARLKPAPDSLLAACQKLSLETRRCVYVGDDERDIVAARAAGMPSVAAGWGYLGKDRPIEQWGADHLAPRVADLALLLS